MGAFLVYIFKSAVCLTLFYLFHKLLLSRETFHRFNRVAILGMLAVALLLPFVEVRIEREAHAPQTIVEQTMLTLEQLLLMADAQALTTDVDAHDAQPETRATAPNTVTGAQIILIVYLAGIVFFVGRHLYGLVCMWLLMRSSRKEPLAKHVTLVVHHKENVAPFSWMNRVVISAKDLEENGREILIHELAHVRNAHSIDLLVTDICIFLQWFNPTAWLLKQELQNIHEFEADESVIGEGVNAKQYQLLLIKKAVGTRLYSMANSLNHSKLKKRITMMMKEKSSPWARLKYLYVLPVAAVAVTAFARPEVKNELNELSAVKVNDLVAIVETTALEKVQQEVKKDTVSKKQRKTPPPPPPAISDEKAAANGKKDKGTPPPPPPPPVIHKKVVFVEAKEAGTDTVKTRYTVINSKDSNGSVQNVSKTSIRFSVSGKSGESDKKPLFIVNGKEISDTTMEAIDPEKFEDIVVLKDEAALEKYGDKAKNGVIVITLKDEPKPNEVTHVELAQTLKYLGNPNEVSGDWTIYIDGVKVKHNELRNLDGVSIRVNAEKKELNITTGKEK